MFITAHPIFSDYCGSDDIIFPALVPVARARFLSGKSSLCCTSPTLDIWPSLDQTVGERLQVTEFVWSFHLSMSPLIQSVL